MKHLPIAIAFITGGIVAGVCFELKCWMDQTRRDLRFLSEVTSPMSSILDDIVSTEERGDSALARRNTRILRERWREYVSGGAAPEMFYQDVTTSTSAASRPITP